MHLIVFKSALVDIAILEPHFALKTHVVLPSAIEGGAVSPSDLTLAFTLACLPVAFIASFFELLPVASRKRIVVLHSSEATGAAILKGSSEFVAVLEINHAQTTQQLDQRLAYL